MDAASVQMDQIIRTFRVKSLPVRVMTRLAKCRKAVDPNRPVVPPVPPPVVTSPAGLPTMPVGSTLPVLTALVEMPPPPAKAPAALPVHDWSNSLDRLTALMRQAGMSRSAMHDFLLESVRTGLGAKDCLLFSAEPGSKTFPLIRGLGEIYGRLHQEPGPAIASGERTVLGVCLARNENIIIHHAHEEKIQLYLPPWLKGHAELGAFVLLPLSDGLNIGGVVVVGWAESRQIVLGPECVRTVRTMLALACRVGSRMAA
jgi:hypothetical protein